MTLLAQATSTCPGCGAEIEAEVFLSVNVSVNPELKRRVLDDSLFDHDCPRCGKLSRSANGLLYHDMERRVQVDVRPEGDPPSDAAVELAETMLNGPVGEGYRLRWVEGGYELAEKVRVFDAGLDDRLVELMKVWALGRTEHMEKPLVFVGLDPSRNHVEFLTDSGEAVSASCDQYARLREHFAPKLKPDRGWQKIDRQFALRVLGIGSRAAKQPLVMDTIARGRPDSHDRKRAQHDVLVRGTAIFAVVTGLLGWLLHGKTVGLAVLGSNLLLALLFALCPPKPTQPGD